MPGLCVPWPGRSAEALLSPDSVRDDTLPLGLAAPLSQTALKAGGKGRNMEGIKPWEEVCSLVWEVEGGGGVVSDGPYSRLSHGPDWDPVPWFQNGPS